ncbi:MAG: ABC transporter ATP-binding protein [bacterium]|nr:ABC transporter ATP-binding protein [bacterium]
MFEIRNCSKWYPSGSGRSYVLRDVSLAVERGEFVSIMGPSGAGKSTLLHILGLLDSPSDGSYIFMGQDVTVLKEKQRAQLYKQHIGFVFQSYHLLDELTVYENLETPLLYKNVPTPERKALIADVLDRFNIVGKKDLFPSQLSGGQQQLVGIARAVIYNPDLILADEPTGNLNSGQGEEIMSLFRTLNKEGTTIVPVTHSEKNASFGSRVINLLDGRVEKS